MKMTSALGFSVWLCLAWVMLTSLSVVSASARDCDTITYGTELVDDVTFCASSVLPNSRVATYRPGNLSGWENNAHRAWCEGDYDNGIGEWFEFTARPGTSIRKMVFMNGYQKSRKSFTQNARARDITIRTDRGLVLHRRLKDRMGSQVVNLGGWQEFNTIRVTIRSVYAGSKYKDLCISGFNIDFEELREFEFQQLQ